jgi:hypothetical protein
MFKDKNLKLALLNYIDSLRKKYHYGWEADYDKFCLKNFGKIINDNQCEPSSEIESFFLGLEIAQEELDNITSITFDGDNSVYAYIMGEVECWGDYFNVTSLEGIENCSNLRRIDFATLTKKVDLQPLIQLKNLEFVSLDFYSAINYNALLDIPNLKKVEIWNNASFEQADKEELAKVIIELEKKGIVTVDTSNNKLRITT